MPTECSTVVSCAEFSDDGQYRYSLTRTIRGPERQKLLFVLLNPSRANAVLNDETVMNCQNIAFRDTNPPSFGPFTSFRVCNLFARVGQAAALRNVTLQARIGEPGSPQRNDGAIETACGWADQILCGWGVLLSNADRRREVMAVLRESQKPLWCLGVNGNGVPYHPSRGSLSRPIERCRPHPTNDSRLELGVPPNG